MLNSLILLFVHLISLCCPVLFQARPIDSLNRTSNNLHGGWILYARDAHVYSCPSTHASSSWVQCTVLTKVIAFPADWFMMALRCTDPQCVSVRRALEEELRR